MQTARLLSSLQKLSATTVQAMIWGAGNTYLAEVAKHPAWPAGELRERCLAPGHLLNPMRQTGVNGIGCLGTSHAISRVRGGDLGRCSATTFESCVRCRHD